MLRWLWSIAVLGSVLALAAPARAEHSLRIATVAPKNSAWGKVFNVWSKAIEKKTNGELKLTVYYNAVQGGDDAMVGKMKSGQLDGAALTSVGLSRIYRDVLVLQLPGVVDSWATLDKVRGKLGSRIDQGFEAKGFMVIGWGDIGLVRQMSHGFAIREPKDVRGKHPVVWRNEPMAPVIYSSIGGVVPVPLGPPEVLPALRSGKVDMINAPALAAEQLQWTPYLDHISGTVSVCAVGGTVLRKESLDALPADVKASFLELQKKMGQATKNRVRKLDEAAYKRISAKMTVVQLSEANKSEWKKVLSAAVKRLAQGTFDRDLVKQVLKITGKG